MPDKTYFEKLYKGPWTGVDNSMPENMIPSTASPDMINFILKNGEIRTRPQASIRIPGTPDKRPMSSPFTFMDSNNVIHTLVVTSSGLWQLNRNWAKICNNINPNIRNQVWAKVGAFPVQPAPNVPLAAQTFVNKFFWTQGSNNLWSWDGISSVGYLSPWKAGTQYYIGGQIQDPNGNWQVVTQAGISAGTIPTFNTVIGSVTNDGTSNLQWTNNGKPLIGNGGIQANAICDATNGISCGGYFLGEIGARLVILNTIEGAINSLGTQTFTQRIRWSPSGIPNIFDPNVNIGAGFVDLLEVPDSITGALFIGSTMFVIRSNGVTEASLNNDQSGFNPFSFNHLWASQNGIGNIYPFSIAQYGPVGMMVSSDEVYEVSLGGFKEVGGTALDSIFSDLANATQTPCASMLPFYQKNYIYLQYQLNIPIGNNTKVWRYSIKDKSWQSDLYSNRLFMSAPNFVAVS